MRTLSQQSPSPPVPTPGLPIAEPTRSFWTYPPSAILAHLVQEPDGSQCAAVPEYADVVVIGSGISGASFVRTLLNADQQRVNKGEHEHKRLSVVMLEAHDANGGHINPPLYHDYEELKNTLGLRAAQHIIRFRLAHLEIQRRVGETDAPDADCREVEAVDVYYDEETLEEAKRLLKVYKRDMPVEGQQYECVVKEAARKRYHLSEYALGCIATRAGAVHPYRFVTGVLTRLLEDHPNQFSLHTNTPCMSIMGPSENEPFYILQTPRGRLKTKHVVHLTNSHVGALVPGLAPVVTQARETMSAQRPGRELRAKMGAGVRSYVFYDDPVYKGFDYLTQLRSGEYELMFGGGLEEGSIRCTRMPGMYDLHSATHVSGALAVYFGAENWGAEGASSVDGRGWAAGRVKALWSGELSESADGFPWVGRIPVSVTGRGRPPKVDKEMASPGEWVAAGYSGEGMVHAWLCARAVALMVLGMEVGQSVREWLPARFLVSETRLRQVQACQRQGRRSRANVYRSR
ncbi:FAD dependent oxidoreductase [Pisolithus sp. B1]|nr:FAD dependent oxidoreductase [Pisolithus sp. B1]